MEYVGPVVPFYISRYRLLMLEDQVGKTSYKVGFSVSIPGIGQLTFDMESATGRQLKRVLAHLVKDNAIGDAQEDSSRYTWVSTRSSVLRVKDDDGNVDHLVFADLATAVPDGWCCLLAGARANLTSLQAVDLPAFGSSPLAVQWALEHVLSNRPQPLPSHHDGQCSRLRASALATAHDPTCHSWKISGLVEIVDRCTEHELLVGAPLFLTYNG